MSEQTKGRGSGEERLEHRNDGQQIRRVEGWREGNWKRREIGTACLGAGPCSPKPFIC